MDEAFWLQIWREGHIPFHLGKPAPALVQHWPALSLPAGSRVLVPLCGKSQDLLWLRERGHRVLGVELSPLAVQQFFDENGLRPTQRESPAGRHYEVERLELIQGDVFALDARTIAGCDAVYDRGALIALPADMRRRYADHVYGQLGAGRRALLLTLEYCQTEMPGPPFSVDEPALRALLGTAFEIDALARVDALAAHQELANRGLSALQSAVYALRREPVPC